MTSNRYLNNRSGDVFQPVQTEGVWTWKPVGNVGLRVHVPPPPQSSDIPRSVNESLFKKRKNYLHHWAFLGVPDQVMANRSSISQNNLSFVKRILFKL